MANKIKLTQGGVVAYPITIVDAVVDSTSKKKLTDVLSSLSTSAEGWKLEQDANSSLIYHLVDAAGTNHGTINIPQDTFLDKAEFSGATNKLTLTFNTLSGKEAVEVDMSSLVDTYTAGNGLSVTDKKFDIVIKSGEKYLEVTADGLATVGIDAAIRVAKDDAITQSAEALEQAVTDLNIADQTNATNISGLKGIVGTQKDVAATGDNATAFGRIKNLETVVADLTGSGDGTVESVETQINNAISSLKGDAESATIGAVEDIAQQGVSDAAAAQSTADKVTEDLTSHAGDTTIHITAAERADWNSAVTEVEVVNGGEPEDPRPFRYLALARTGNKVSLDVGELNAAIDSLYTSISSGLKGTMGTVEYEDVTDVALA